MSAPAADAQLVTGIDFVRGGDPSEFEGLVGVTTERHLVAYAQSHLRDDELGEGCSMGMRYEFTPRGVFSAPPNPPAAPAGRIRRLQLFGASEVAAVYGSCGSTLDSPTLGLEPEQPETGFGRFYNASVAISGGVRIMLFDSSSALNGALRIAVGSRRFFGAGDQPGRTAAGVSVGFSLFWFPLRE